MSGSYFPLELPAELSGVPTNVLKDFLSQFSRLLLCQLAPDIPDHRIQASVNELLGNVGAGNSKPVDVRLEFKHVCKFMGCSLEECQLCRNNPNKVCDDANCFDHQYWVRDDGKGGQLIKAKCGADVSLQLIDKATGVPVFVPDVRIKLYVINGQQLAASGMQEPAGGLYLSDDNHPLFTAAGTATEDDKGLPIDLSQSDRLGPVGHIPELQFLDKNSKFKVGGRTFKCFKLLARALRRDATSGAEVVVAQVESESFKVTTKKGYDGCRKADYLYAHDPITDKTFANLGETTISNLKANFDGVETVEDLMQLVQACRSAPDMELRLRETLNMARDVEKWRNLIRMLSEKVVWDDSMARIFVVPTGARPLGLLYRANKGQVDFSSPTGLILHPPAPTGQLCVVRLNDRLSAAAGRQVEALRQLASSYWKFPRHPGWALAPDSPIWEDANANQIVEAFCEVMGQGDPSTLVDMHLAALQQAQLAAVGMGSAAAGAALLRSSTPVSGAVTPAPLLSPAVAANMPGALGSLNAAQAGWGFNGAAVGGLGGGAVGAGVITDDDLAAAAAAAALSGGTGGGGAMSVSGGTTTASPAGPTVGGGGLSGNYDSSVVDSHEAAAAAATAAAAMYRLGGPQGNLQQTLTLGHRPGSTRPTVTTSTHPGMGPTATAAGGGGLNAQGLLLPTVVPPHQAFAGSGGAGPSPFSLTAGVSSGPTAARSVSAGMTDSEGMLAAGGQQQQQRMYTGMMTSIGVMPSVQGSMPLPQGSMAGSMQQGLPSGSAPMQLQMQGALSAGPAGPSNSGTSGLSVSMDGQQQPSQQQQQMLMMLQQQQQQLSSNTLLLQQAMIEGWPAPQVKAVLDQMTDEELAQLVAQQPGTAAGVLARAGGEELGGLGALEGMAAQQQQQPAQQQPAQQQPQQGAVIQGSGQGQAGAHSYQMHMTVGPGNTTSNKSAGQGRAQQTQQQQQQQQQQQALKQEPQQQLQAAAGAGADPPAGATAAAALAALFADADGLAVNPAGRSSFDVSLTADQMNAAALLNLSADSLSEPANWGDLLENLRQLSSSSGGAGGAVAGSNALGASFSTEWIPELLFRLESESKDKENKENAAAAAGATAATAAAAAGGGAGDDGGGAGEESKGGRKMKRERSKTAQGPTPEQLAQLQALFAADPSQLRSLSKGESHLGSFNRHFPTARCSSQTQDVQQGAQVANPWNPGMRMSATGVPTSPEQPGNNGTHGRSITTHAPGAPQAGNSRMVSVGAGAATAGATTEAGAAAVATVTGLEALQPVQEGQPIDNPSSELLSMLGMLNEEPLGGGSGGGGAEMYTTSAIPERGAATHMATPFLTHCSADAAAAMVHAPTTQRDSSGKAGWISSLFRSGSSWSSKSNSLHGSGSGAFGSMTSHSSKDTSGQRTPGSAGPGGRT